MDYIKKNKTDNPQGDLVKSTWENPVGKAVIIISGGFGVLVTAGFAFRALAYATRGFKEFTSALKS